MDKTMHDALNPDLATPTESSPSLTKGSITRGNTTLAWKVKPKVKFGELLKNGDLAAAIGGSKLSLDFTTVCPDDEVTVTVKVNGNVALIFDSPKTKKDFSAQVCATKQF